MVSVELYNMTRRQQLTELGYKPRWPLILLGWTHYA